MFSSDLLRFRPAFRALLVRFASVFLDFDSSDDYDRFFADIAARGGDSDTAGDEGA